MIVITGATGALNGTTLDHLLERLDPSEIAVAVRDVAKARGLAERGVEVRHGDYAEPSSLPGAFEGADQLLLVSSNDPGADAVSLHRAAVDAAVTAGVGRVLYTSHQGAAPDSPFAPCRVHAATEDLLAASGLAWTALRNGFYAHSLGWLAGPWRETGAMSVPVDGRVSWTARADSAEAAANIIASDAVFDGPTTITASDAPTFADVTAIATELLGRPVELDVVGPDRWIADRVAAGMPDGAAHFALGIFQAAEAGLFAGTDPLLAQLLDREPETVRDALAQEAGS